jgi:hypothetical protein
LAFHWFHFDIGGSCGFAGCVVECVMFGCEGGAGARAGRGAVFSNMEGAVCHAEDKKPD